MGAVFFPNARRGAVGWERRAVMRLQLLCCKMTYGRGYESVLLPLLLAVSTTASSLLPADLLRSAVHATADPEP
jgi:hypothetical protein